MRTSLWISLTCAASIALAAGCGKRRGGGKMIQNKGSDTMVNLAQAWAEEYRKVNPQVAIAVTGGGSGTGIAALINGTVDIANASREMKPAEKAEAKKNTGKDPVEHTVAFDALAIYVHKSNPMASISKEQLACIYGENGTCNSWSDLKVQVPGCSGQEIVRVGRQNNSGTYMFFREWVVGEKNDFKLGSRDMQGSKDVVDLVERTPCAVGYSGIGYKTGSVKAVCVSLAEGEPCVEPSIEAALSGKYPISRALYMITLGEPTGDLKGFLDWARSDAGQSIVERTGYAPLPKEKRTQAAPAK
ncbi:MAG TPA: phosphate ABC transporter substrate-binding protein [Kofleriaceae bacterium]|nr:phosphate ABC transporter substrate-binding protein [Kofleriaceae bacterium]